VDLAEVLKVVRRRWMAVALTVLVALAAGWASTRLISTTPPPRPYRATAVLFSAASQDDTAYPLATIASLVKFDDVATEVAANLNYQGDLRKLTRKVEALADEDRGLLSITATSTDRNEARVVADEFARQIILFLNRQAVETAQQLLNQAKDDLARIEPELQELNAAVAANPTDELLRADRDTVQSEWEVANQQLRNAQAQIASVTPALVTIQDAVPIRSNNAGIINLRSAPVRLILAGLLGLIGGMFVAMILDRLDNRLRSKVDAERRMDLPVIAEIPTVRNWKHADGGIALATNPKSPEADAFRLLAANLVRRPPEAPQTILVTSPGPSEGKTTVTANLAATFAEVGKRVIVLSCDLHRPRIHVLFGVPNMSGLAEALQSPGNNGPLLSQKNWRTSIDRVHLVPSGMSPENPGELLSSGNMRRVLEEAKTGADIVLLDTPPILAASDGAQLLSQVDAVLLVVRGEKTVGTTAERTADLLRGLKVPVVGTVLNEAPDLTVPRGYYDYYREPNPAPPTRRSVRPALLRAGSRGSR
jgi:capsular exopolysaccharide synthesis family protein